MITDEIRNIEQLEEMISEPSFAAVEALAKLEGDLVILGVGGKMGPSLARMAKRASDDAGVKRRVIGVDVFPPNNDQQQKLRAVGVETIKCDLLDPQQLESLPDAPNVVFMVGMKFGSTGQEPLTWALNSFLPGMVCRKYKNSRITAFSSGNIYGLSPVILGGSVETDPLNPEGEYAITVLGRERVFQHFSLTQGTPVTLFRLNYSVEMRYGVLVDVAQKVWAGEPVEVTMACANAIWQADANSMALASLAHAASPAFIVNAAGPEMLSFRRVALQFGEMMGREVTIAGCEAQDSLISNGQLGHALFGYPRVGAHQMMRWIASWVMRGGENIGKPTHFEARDGKY